MSTQARSVHRMIANAKPRMGAGRATADPSEVRRVTRFVPAEPRAVLAEALPPVTLGVGCVRRELPAPPGARAWMIEMGPGSEWPWVDRVDTGEAYFVVSGEVIEGDLRHPAGTQVLFAPGSRHRPRSEIGARLIGFHLDADAFLGAGGNPDALIGRLHLQQG